MANNLFDNVSNIFKEWSKLISDSLNDILGDTPEDEPFSVTVEIKNKENKKVHKLKVDATPKGVDKYDITVTSDNDKRVSYKRVPEDEFVDTLRDVAKDTYGQDVELYKIIDTREKASRDRRKVASATKPHLRICARKVYGSIELDGFDSNYSAAKTSQDVADIIALPDFANMIDSCPATYEIDVSPDNYDVVSADISVNINMFSEIFIACTQCLHDLQWVHWLAAGKNMMSLHDFSENLYHTCAAQQDMWAELCVEYTDCIINLNTVRINDCILDTSTKFNIIEGCKFILSSLSNYISKLEMYYPYLSHDVQSEVDNMLRGWYKCKNYNINRILADECNE